MRIVILFTHAIISNFRMKPPLDDDDAILTLKYKPKVIASFVPRSSI